MDILKKENAQKVGNDVIIKVAAAIIFAGLSVAFTYSMIHKLEVIMYTSIAGFALLLIYLFYLISKKWVMKMIDEQAAKLFEEKIASVKETIHLHHDEQYSINCSDSDRITKLGFQISQQDEETRKRIMNDIEELHLPINLAIALLVQNLSNTVYNGRDMKARTGLDDFVDNFKSSMMAINIPNKDNHYKDGVINKYFETLTKLSGKLLR